MHFLRLVASIVVICSGCSQPPNKALEAKLKTKADSIKIGVTTDLLSFDPFSFQSLGERKVIDLIYGRFFTFESHPNGSQIRSNYLTGLRLEKNKLSFNSMDDELFLKIKNVFEKGNSSVLWKTIFLQFDLYKDSITYKNKSDFIGQLKNLAPLLVFENEGVYKVKEHIKGQKVVLTTEDKSLIKNLIVLRVKDSQSGIKLVESKGLDVFYPGSLFSKGLIEAYKNITAVKAEDQFLYLRLYYKFKGKNPLSKSYCLNKIGIKKMLGDRWVLEKDSCLETEDEPAKKLYIIYSDSFGMKVLDFLFDKYKNSKGKKIDYEELKSTKLTKVLKMGRFDYYLSLEKLSRTTPVMFDSFHSKGRYNTYRLNDVKLDLLLDKVSESTDLKAFDSFSTQARKRLFEVMPLVFSYKMPVINYIKHSENERISLKSSKRLIFLKE